MPSVVWVESYRRCCVADNNNTQNITLRSDSIGKINAGEQRESSAAVSYELGKDFWKGFCMRRYAQHLGQLVLCVRMPSQ